MAYDPFKYIRDYYGVPATEGKVVSCGKKFGVIMGASGPHVEVKLDGEKIVRIYHPEDLKY